MQMCPEHGQAFSWQIHVETIECLPLYTLHVAYERQATAMGAPVIAPHAARDYGLRDWNIANPDGFGIRFRTRIVARQEA